MENKIQKIKKKKLLDITLEDKKGRTMNFVYGGSYDDEYVVNYIMETLPKLKLGDKLIIKPMELIK